MGVFGSRIQPTDMPVDGVLTRVYRLWCTVFSLGRGSVELLRMGFLDLMGLRLVRIWGDVMLLIREPDMVMDIPRMGDKTCYYVYLSIPLLIVY